MGHMKWDNDGTSRQAGIYSGSNMKDEKTGNIEVNRTS